MRVLNEVDDWASLLFAFVTVSMVGLPIFWLICAEFFH